MQAFAFLLYDKDWQLNDEGSHLGSDSPSQAYSPMYSNCLSVAIETRRYQEESWQNSQSTSLKMFYICKYAFLGQNSPNVGKFGPNSPQRMGMQIRRIVRDSY